ncbi:hypothetical protein [Polaromonas sp.]|uniref:hypothetical protein n=1 Tax=Polaromonas sp. TaxID=1869339 RepID=UPI003750A8AB
MTTPASQAVEAAVQRIENAILEQYDGRGHSETGFEAILELVRAELASQQVAAPVWEIDAALLKLSAETHKAVDDTIHSLQKLEGTDPIPAQWWGIVSMALYKAALLGAAAPFHPQDGKDAERYRWLKTRFIGADFDWNENGESVLVFEWPASIPVGANCDGNIDAAIQASEKPTAGTAGGDGGGV